jgi:hypothetical protein
MNAGTENLFSSSIFNWIKSAPCRYFQIARIQDRLFLFFFFSPSSLFHFRSLLFSYYIDSSSSSATPWFFLNKNYNKLYFNNKHDNTPLWLSVIVTSLRKYVIELDECFILNFFFICGDLQVIMRWYIRICLLCFK